MMTHATENAIRTALLDSQRRVLERIARGAPLAEIFETLVRLVEEQARGMRCAVLLADLEEGRLRFVAAPHIPQDYKAGIEPYLRIAPRMGSSGTAAFLREPVFTEDTATDPRWEDCRDVAVRNGLRAIWSTPILSDDNTVLGTFAMYYGEPRLPSAAHIQLIDMAVQMACVAIQRKDDEERLRASEEKFRLIAENARDLITIVESTGRRLYISPSFRELYGESQVQYSSAFDNTFQEDRERVAATFNEMVRTGVGVRVEFRVRDARGELRRIQSEGSPIRDASGRVAAVLCVGRDVTNEYRTHEALQRSAEELQALSRRMVELQECERRQLANELHDRVGQSLTALSLNLRLLEGQLPTDAAEARARVEDSVALVESTAAAIGDVLSELRPPMLDDAGLFLALEWHGRQVAARTGITVQVSCAMPDVRLAPNVEIALFRIAQEALNNVVKHADASRVEIALERSAAALVMTITDDGVGLRPAASTAQASARPGLGLVTMRERAQALGGRFEAAALKRGTRITVEIPS